MKKKLLYIILLGFTLFSCIEDSGNYNYQDINRLTISGVKESYSIIMGDELSIEPAIEQTVSNDKLEYVWKLEDKVLSNDKDLNIKLTEEEFVYGKQVMTFTVIDKSYEEDVQKTVIIELSITSTMSYGYYFLTANENDESYLSYFSSNYITEDNLYLPDAKLLHINHVEDVIGKKYFFGKKPISITGFPYQAAQNIYYSHLYILSEESEYPSIQTDNVLFRLNSYQNNESFLEPGHNFRPTAMLNFHKEPYVFISNNQLVLMRGRRLYRPAKHKKEYKWKAVYSPIRMSALSSVFVHDELTNKIYYACPETTNFEEGILGDPLTYDAIIDIKDSPSLVGKAILGSSDVAYVTKEIIQEGENTKEKEIYHMGINLCLASSSALEFYQYYMPQIDMVKYPPHFLEQEKKTIVTNKFSENSKLLHTDSDWYITSKNVIYTVIPSNGEIKTYATLPIECGEITCIEESKGGKSFVITTFDTNSPNNNKGSIIFIDKKSKKQFIYKNVINRCVDILAANESSVQ